jgi:hypothetical protein
MKISNDKIVERIENLEPFENLTGSMRGQWGAGSDGKPSPEFAPFAPQFEAACRKGGDIYVVYSYTTPIAWKPVKRGFWTIPQVNYSQTTLRHQAIVRKAVM